MKSIKINLLDNNGNVQYGLNWGRREKRDPNQAYLQLTPDIYKGDFFPIKGKYFIVNTDDEKVLIFNRAQKDYGSALQTPENNSIIGEYLRERMGVPSGSEITKEHVTSYGRNTITIYKRDDMHYILDFSNKAESHGEYISHFSNYLAAMRTKPFLLLAGISGTGKSRIVKEMAFASCPPSLHANDVTPGNYCMIEVKPNWHDSTELIGYESKIGGDHYVVTPFINFLIKALHNPKIPFFVCLDEMNLAPVEQYFAEFLSVLESRKLVNGKIVSEALIKPEIFSKTENFDSFKNAYYRGALATSGLAPEEYSELWKDLGDNGLRLPPNVIVVGTVNMDETTYQFSRKVIDRAMTIEMNEVNFDSMFGDAPDTLKYRGEDYVKAEYFLPKYSAAKDALTALSDTDREYLKDNIPAMLKSLDEALANTPFRIAYRVENELLLYFAALREEQPDATADALLATAVDDILMMKVLPRIEGNEDVLTEPLKRLENFTRDNYPKAYAKVQEMQSRLEANHFTSFWP